MLDLPLPTELDQVPPERVYALTIQPDALLQIRRERLLRIHMATDTSYGQRDYILREIYYARDVLRSHRDWTTIDVTGKAIEETAADVLRLFHQRTGTPMH